MRPLTLVALLFASSCAAAEPDDLKALVKKEIEKLQGGWSLETLSLNGEKQDVRWGKRRPTWRFQGDRLTMSEGREEKEVVGFHLDPSTNPKQLDLLPVKKDQSVAKKGIYSIDADTLIVAFTFVFAPGTPEAELERAREAGRNRPESFEASLQHPLQSVQVVKFKKVRGETKGE